jgi:hypothetical protein
LSLPAYEGLALTLRFAAGPVVLAVTVMITLLFYFSTGGLLSADIILLNPRKQTIFYPVSGGIQIMIYYT